MDAQVGEIGQRPDGAVAETRNKDLIDHGGEQIPEGDEEEKDG